MGDDGFRSTAIFQFTFSAAGQVQEAEVLEVSGLTDESDVVEHKVITDGFKEAIEKVPGRNTGSGQISIKRAIISGRKDFWDWRQMVVDGAITGARTNCAVTAYGVDNTTVIAEYEFINAWPSKVSGPDFDTENSQYVTEELTIVYEYYKRNA
ncbi:MAG: phage tail protein [Chloroflexota bacterium]